MIELESLLNMLNGKVQLGRRRECHMSSTCMFNMGRLNIHIEIPPKIEFNSMFDFTYNVHIYKTVYITQMVYIFCRKKKLTRNIGPYFDRARILLKARDKHRFLSSFFFNFLVDKGSINTLI